MAASDISFSYPYFETRTENGWVPTWDFEINNYWYIKVAKKKATDSLYMAMVREFVPETEINSEEFINIRDNYNIKTNYSMKYYYYINLSDDEFLVYWYLKKLSIRELYEMFTDHKCMELKQKYPPYFDNSGKLNKSFVNVPNFPGLVKSVYQRFTVFHVCENFNGNTCENAARFLFGVQGKKDLYDYMMIDTFLDYAETEYSWTPIDGKQTPIQDACRYQLDWLEDNIKDPKNTRMVFLACVL